jgi:SagB-type dehydrogenase family enzyme
MSFFLYKFFHNKINERAEKGLVSIPENPNEWPDSWKEIAYKNYILFKPVILPKMGGALWDILEKRRSSGACLPDNIVTLEKVAHILRCGYGLQGDMGKEGRTENRTVPSAGQRYPLEVYLFLFSNLDACRAGVYHYGIKDHVLEPVRVQPFREEDIRSFSSQEVVRGAKGMVCFSLVFHRVVEKYGSRGYRHALLEAGHAAQNMALAGVEAGVAFIPIGGSDEGAIEKYIGLNPRNEGVIYTLFF